MKAPEKIYISIHSGIHHYEQKNDDDIEYIRKDTFIKKACEFLDGCIPDYIDLKHANVDTFMDVDNERFIDEFKTYMEGE